MFYGIWGDTNGDDGPAVVGEASLATGTLCYGDSVNGNSGHDATDVLYVAFTGAEAVPGKSGAKWNAQSAAEFEASIAALGDSLVARLSGGNGTGTAPVSSGPTSAGTTLATSAKPTSTGGTCSWAGHCAGAACSSDDDCSDDLTCRAHTCG